MMKLYERGLPEKAVLKELESKLKDLKDTVEKSGG